MTAATLEPKARITARVAPSVQSVLEDAAAFLGVPLNSFIISAAVEKAGQVLATERTIKLSREDAELFAGVMENPPGPNEAVLRAAKSYGEIVLE